VLHIYRIYYGLNYERDPCLTIHDIYSSKILIRLN